MYDKKEILTELVQSLELLQQFLEPPEEVFHQFIFWTHHSSNALEAAEMKAELKIWNNSLSNLAVSEDESSLRVQMSLLRTVLLGFLKKLDQYNQQTAQNISATNQINVTGNVSDSTIIIGNDNGVQSSINRSFTMKIERLMPALLDEMSKDILDNLTTREFVILKRSWAYNSNEPYLAYYLDEHQDLEGKLQVLINLGLIREITYNNVRRFLFQEDFVDYLIEK